MRRLSGIIIILMMGLTAAAYAQEIVAQENISTPEPAASSYDFHAPERAVLNRALRAPNKISDNVYALTRYLIKPYNNDYDKLKVIAYWIASHIAYDSYKYDGKINMREMNVKYDILQAKVGICGDFSELMVKMANIAGVRNVKYVSGYHVEGVSLFKRNYSRREMPDVRHAWNEAKIDGRKFFIDTTFMARGTIGDDGRRKSLLHHKLDVKKRGRSSDVVNENINTFYFDFTPKQEFKKSRSLHVMDKYVR